MELSSFHSCFVLGLDAQAALFIPASLFSLVGGAFVAGSCAWLYRRHPDCLLVSQLGRLGLVDTAEALWKLWLYFGVVAGWRDFKYCRWYSAVEFFLLILSVLFSLSLALSLVVELLRIRVPCALRHSGWLALGLAALLNIVYILPYNLNISFDVGNATTCFSFGMATDIYAVEVLVIFLSVSILHVIVLMQAWRSAPRSVARRSAQSAVRYLLAFFMTHTLFAIEKIWTWLQPEVIHTCQWDYIRLIATFLLHLNGFWNFLSFAGHLWYIRSRSRRASDISSGNVSLMARPKQVNFCAEGRLQETLEVPYGEEQRRPAKAEFVESVQELGACLAELSFCRQHKRRIAAGTTCSKCCGEGTDGGGIEGESQSDKASFGDES